MSVLDHFLSVSALKTAKKVQIFSRASRAGEFNFYKISQNFLGGNLIFTKISEFLSGGNLQTGGGFNINNPVVTELMSSIVNV